MKEAQPEMRLRQISMRWRILYLLTFAMLTVGPGRVHAEDVSIEIQGLSVIGNLETAPGKSLEADGVVLLLHDTLAHNRMEIMSAVQELLRERGHNTLSITLSLGLNARRGLYDCAIEQDHRNEDAAVEIAAWVNWLKERGVSDISLAGHGRGANQMAIYAAKNPDKATKRLILIAPIADTTGTMAQRYAQKFRQPLEPILTEAQKLVDRGLATALLTDVPFLVCNTARVTAAAFVNYYGANQNLYTPSLLPHLQMPVLVAIGDLDPLSSEIIPAVEGIPGAEKITLSIVPGADNFFRDLAAEDLAQRISEFVAGN